MCPADGQCNSACTLVLANPWVCTTDNGYFNFHAARDPRDDSFAPKATAWMMKYYPQKVQDWIASKGGLTTEWLGVHAQKFRPKCEEAKIP